jgi:hypothetical protein
MLMGCADYDLLPTLSPPGPGDRTEDDTFLPVELTEVLTQVRIDSLKELGFPVHTGNRPPRIEGIYRASEFYLQVPYGPEDYNVGEGDFDDFLMRFHDYDASTLTVLMDYRNGNTEQFDVLCYLSGQGQQFTLSYTDRVVSTGTNGNRITTTTTALISARLRTDGLADYYNAFVIVNKIGDPDNQDLIPEGTGRIFIDFDGLAELESVFRRRAPNPATPLRGQALMRR